MKYLLVCSCFNMEKKAREAFSVLFPNEVSPTVVKGKDNIAKLSKSFDNEHIRAISKLTGKFAFYVHMNESNQITEEYNLITMKRTA